MNYIFHLAVLTEIYLILALSLNLMVGHSGLFSLAHAAFYGIGAYVTALLMIHLGIHFFLAVFVAQIVTVLLSLLISFASLRFKGDYFILVTMAFQVIVYAILYNWVSLTRGPFGLTNIPKPKLFGTSLDTPLAFSIFGLAFAALAIVALTIIFRSPFGRTLQAIRDDEMAAIALGKRALSFKMRSVAIASAVAAGVGGFYATYATFIDPTSFNTEESILLLSMVIVGGTGNIKGPIVGAFLLVLTPELLRFISLPQSILPNVRLIIYGFLLILMMRFRPQGVAGKYRFE